MARHDPSAMVVDIARLASARITAREQVKIAELRLNAVLGRRVDAPVEALAMREAATPAGECRGGRPHARPAACCGRGSWRSHGRPREAVVMAVRRRVLEARRAGGRRARAPGDHDDRRPAAGRRSPSTARAPRTPRTRAVSSKCWTRTIGSSRRASSTPRCPPATSGRSWRSTSRWARRRSGWRARRLGRPGAVTVARKVALLALIVAAASAAILAFATLERSERSERSERLERSEPPEFRPACAGVD